jgi:hypothetical protein
MRILLKLKYSDQFLDKSLQSLNFFIRIKEQIFMTFQFKQICSFGPLNLKISFPLCLYGYLRGMLYQHFLLLFHEASFELRKLFDELRVVISRST